MLEFGINYYVGSFIFKKITKKLNAKQLKALREGSGLKKNSKLLNFNAEGVPYIRITTISEDWSIEFACTTQMFVMLNSLSPETMNNEDRETLHIMFTRIYTDCVLLGDEQYIRDKYVALSKFIRRKQEGLEISEEDDAQILEEERQKEALQQKMLGSVNDIIES